MIREEWIGSSCIHSLTKWSWAPALCQVLCGERGKPCLLPVRNSGLSGLTSGPLNSVLWVFFLLGDLRWDKSWLVPEFTMSFFCELPLVSQDKHSKETHLGGWSLLPSSILTFTANVFPLEFKLMCNGYSVTCIQTDIEHWLRMN